MREDVKHDLCLYTHYDVRGVNVNQVHAGQPSVPISSRDDLQRREAHDLMAVRLAKQRISRRKRP